MLALAEPEQLRPDQRAARPGRTACRLPRRRPGGGPRLRAAGARQVAKVDDRRAGSDARPTITWTGRPSTAGKVVRSASWRRTISCEARARSAGTSSGPVIRTAAVHVEGRLARARAGRGTRGPAARTRAGSSPVARDRPDRWQSDARRRAGRTRRSRRPGPPPSAPRTGARSGTRRGPAPPEPGDDLRGQQRVPAEVEEVVMGADRLDPQDVGPDRRDRLLGRRPRARRNRPASADRLQPWAGRAATSSLPLGVSGKALEHDERRRDHVSGRLGRATAQLLGRRGRRPPADE